jgi:hypothetical protein
MVIRATLFALSTFFFASIAFADPDSGVSEKEAPHDRVVAVANGGLGFMARQASAGEPATGGGFSCGGDIAWLFEGNQGVRVGYAYGIGIFGPELHVVDVGYTWQYNTQRDLKKLTGSFGFVIGPSVGFVNYLGNTPDEHVAFGGRAGAFADLNIWNFALGLDASYRFGFASGYGAEGFGTVGAHLGLTFDVARR